VEKNALKATIHEHLEFATFVAEMNAHFDVWRKRSVRKLKALEKSCYPKQVIAELAEDLLAHYADKPLIDRYDVYQHLLDYWAASMQDGCYLIAADGWKAVPARIIETDKKGKPKDKGWACDLVPKTVIVARYFAEEQAAVDELNAALEAASAKLTELEEEHGGDEGAYSSFDRVNRSSVAARLNELEAEGGLQGEAKEEAVALAAWLKVNAEEAALKARVKELEATLDAKVLGQYPKLSEADVKSLVVEDKWLAALDADVRSEMDRVSKALTVRIEELADRYETPLYALTKRTEDLAATVSRHFEKMGFAWT
jgi:type I restriction enzyme M protein